MNATARLSANILKLALYKSPQGFTVYARTDRYVPRRNADGTLIYGEVVISTERWREQS